MIATDEIKMAKPFLKWAGGKGQLLADIKSALPVALSTGQIKHYVEPFIGGGAVFFMLSQAFEALDEFHIFDANQDLVNCYNAIKEDVESVINRLQEHQEIYFKKDEDGRKDYYLEMRRQFNQKKGIDAKPEIAALVIFLNRTCFNGLYRVNSKGFFNVPFGKYKSPRICNPDNLRSVSSILKRAKVICGDFEKSYDLINEQTFVYFDPPYRPLSKTASFTSYSKDSFTEEDQMRLALFCRKITDKGALFLLSNSDPQNEVPDDNFFEIQYADFSIDKVQASRAINCKGSGRGQINELLITNYTKQSF